MSQTIDLSDAKTQFSQLVERAAAGEEIIITKAGRPMARLGPIKPPLSGNRGCSKERSPSGRISMLHSLLTLWAAHPLDSATRAAH
jgi:prevent-host-death family protein